MTRTNIFARTIFALSLSCFAATLALSLVGCNTVEGAGKDVENAGEAVQDAAD